MRKVGALILVACGGHGGGGKTIGNEAPRAPGAVVRIDDKAPTRDCPPATLAAIAKGWDVLEDSTFYTGGTPQLDACLAGRFAPDGVVVFASAPPPPDSQTEEGTPARELIVDPDGKPRIEGLQTGGDWMTGPPTLAGLADLDGDGLDEIIVVTPVDPADGDLHVLRVGRATLDDTGEAHLYTDICAGTWSVKDGALVIHQTSNGGVGVGPDDGEICDAGDHAYRLINGALAPVG